MLLPALKVSPIRISVEHLIRNHIRCQSCDDLLPHTIIHWNWTNLKSRKSPEPFNGRLWYQQILDFYKQEDEKSGNLRIKFQHTHSEFKFSMLFVFVKSNDLMHSHILKD